MLVPRAAFSRFLDADPQRLHCAAHSHHPWPDVSFEAQQRAWLDAARLQDGKWDHVLTELWPRAQAHVARLLNLPDPSTVCFAGSTHELLMRLCSAIPARPLRVLTTDAEFASFARQLAAWEDAGLARVTRVAAEPFDSFAARWTLAARRGGHDLVYLSQVFYDSGLVSGRLESLVEAVADDATEIVIDGYHAFMALPTDLAGLAGRVHYLAGGYKYAMSGEGCCFLHSPPDRALRPLDTGWFADGGSRAPLDYPADARRFMGATFDPTPLYRFVAVHDWLQLEGVTPEGVHAHVGALQAHFLGRLDGLRLPFDSLALSPPVGLPRGNFLSFVLDDAAAARGALAAAGVVVDHRGRRLRIGFGIYHDTADIDTLLARMAQALGRG